MIAGQRTPASSEMRFVKPALTCADAVYYRSL